ncbi:MAG: NHL repeat-containing protein [Candidatus Brocadiia bacterium]
MKKAAILMIALLLTLAAPAFSENIQLDYETTDLGILLKWEIPPAVAPLVSDISIGWNLQGETGMPHMVAALPSDRTCLLPIDLEQGETLNARITVIYREGGMRILPGGTQIPGPSFDIPLRASASVADVTETSFLLKGFSVEGGQCDEVRVYDGASLKKLGVVPGGAGDLPVTGLESGTRVLPILLPVLNAPDGLKRGRRTRLPAVSTRPKKEWKLVNKGLRLNGDSPLTNLAWTMRHCASFTDRDGNFVFTFPTADLGWGMGRFNRLLKKWEIRSLSGWTTDHNQPVRPVFDGLFSLRTMEFFTDKSGDTHAVTDCSTASNHMILDIHGNLHDMRYRDGDWDQWIGGVDYGRNRSRPLFNSWGGTGTNWGFAMSDSGVGLLMHTHYTLGSDMHLLADRLDLGAKDIPWQRWGKDGWQPHKDYSHEFIVGNSSDKTNYASPRIAPLPDGSFLVVFEYVPPGKPGMWTALRYEDKASSWLRATSKGWAKDGDFVPVYDDFGEDAQATLKRDGKGKAWMYFVRSGRLLRAGYDEKNLRFGEAEDLGKILAGSRDYFPAYSVAQAPSGELVAAFSSTGYDLSVTGKGVVFVSEEQLSFMGFDYSRKEPYLFFRRGGDLLALKETYTTGELAAADTREYRKIERADADPKWIEVDAQWLNMATHTDGKTRPSYGPGESGRIACTAAGMIVSPHFKVCSVTIFPPGAPQEQGVFWGGFWDFFLFPMAAAVDVKRGRIYVSDCLTNGGGGGILGGRIQCWDISEASRCIFTSPGLGQPRVEEKYKPRVLGGYNWPADMAINEERGVMFVCESLDNKVSVWDVTGDQPKKTGEFGADALRFPQALDIGPDGLLYVLDGYTCRVVVYTQEGVQKRSFSGPGRLPGKLLYPWDLAVDPASGNVFVCDQVNGRISVFKPDGTHLYSWTHFPYDAKQRGGQVPDNSDATGLAFDKRGFLYCGVGSDIIRYKVHGK